MEDCRMKIKEKLMMDKQGLLDNGAITIVAFGDSVTHGAVAANEISYETVYWNRLRVMLNSVRDYVPVNVINSGIGGDWAMNATQRFERQALKYEPDLVIICFGLNDINRPKDEYLTALKEMFGKCIESGTDVIFLTPNMLNTYVAEGTEARYLEYAKKTADIQNNGVMDDYIYSAKAIAESMGVPVCDCYSKWKELAKTQDTTMLLANRINHPTKEMHALFAEGLFEIIMGDGAHSENNSESTMFKV